MGFFSELKEDLAQAVNELVSEDEKKLENPVQDDITAETLIPVQEEFSKADEENSMPETAEELGWLIDRMELDIETESEPKEMESESVEEEPMIDELKEEPVLEEELVTEDELIMDDEPEEEIVSEEELITEDGLAEETVSEGEPEDEPEEESVPEEEMVIEEELETETEEITEVITEEQEEIKIQEEEQVEENQYNGMEVENSEVGGEAVDETAMITAGMKVKGDISSQGSLDIIGTVEGNIDILGKLNITGKIEGSSNAADVYAEKARINGDIHSKGSIKIGQSTIIIGNIFASSAVIAGAVKGDIDVKGPVILDTSAIVMGNIKSKSVQINNGAVIEGLCSQCYADVNPSSFFEDLKKARA